MATAISFSRYTSHRIKANNLDITLQDIGDNITATVHYSVYPENGVIGRSARNMNGRSTPLQYRFLVAMQGALGIGANLNHWTDADQSLTTKMISTYKRIRSTIQTGNLYRLISPKTNNDLASTE